MTVIKIVFSKVFCFKCFMRKIINIFYRETHVIKDLAAKYCSMYLFDKTFEIIFIINFFCLDFFLAAIPHLSTDFSSSSTFIVFDT